MPMNHQIDYRASPTLTRFHISDAFVRRVRGPVGSGKSTGMSWEFMRRAREQAPAEDGIRRTRWVVVRNTYRELSDTTVKTWLDWFPEDICGQFNKGSMTHQVRVDGVEL